MQTRRRTTAISLLASLVFLAGCRADPYPLLTPAGASQWTATTIGAPVPGVVLYLELEPGDRIELVSAEAVGLPPGATATFSFSRWILGADGTYLIGDVLEPIEGASYSVDAEASPGPNNDVAIVAKLSSSVAGSFELTSVRLSFRINGGQVVTKEGITQTLGICVANPAPTDCEPPATP